MSGKVVSGLEGIVAAETRVSGVDGEAGELIVGGYRVEDLAPRATFEEVAHLLWQGALPDARQHRELRIALAERRALPSLTLELLRTAAVERMSPMDALRMAAGTLSLSAEKELAHLDRSGQYRGAKEEERTPSLDEVDREQALAITAQFPTIVAAYARLYQGETIVPPDPALGHAANFLFMLRGTPPTPAQTRAMETYLNTVIDHGLNASTFTARVIVSTRSDLLSAIVGAIGALKGPLHGGAPGPALEMVFAIGSQEHAEPQLRKRLDQGERLMGFGHRIYKVRDPRADVLAAAASALYRTEGDRALYELALEVEQVALRLLEQYKPGRRLQTNVEFYTALLLHGLEIPTELFTPTFALGRVAGWIAHSFEQRALDRLIRPQSVYTGPLFRDEPSTLRSA